MAADTDWAEVYRANVDAVSALARTLDAEQLSLVVPATPDWTVHGVIATLEGNESPALVWNCVVHHADLHEALGKGAPPEAMWRPVLEAVAPRMLGESADAVGEVPDYELFRAFFSRR